MAPKQRAVKVTAGLKRKPRPPTTFPGRKLAKIHEKEAQEASHLLDQLAQALGGLDRDRRCPTTPLDRISPEPFDNGVFNDNQPHFDDEEPLAMANYTYLRDYLSTRTYEQRKLAEENQWVLEIPKMFEEYMVARRETRNWGDNLKWDTDQKAPCNCKTKARQVDVLDILGMPILVAIHDSSRDCAQCCFVVYSGRKKIEVKFCPCVQSDLVRLIQVGYIGGTPHYPRTAFSIRLLRLFHVLWKYCALGIEPFANAIDEFLDAASPLMVVDGSNEVSELFIRHQLHLNDLVVPKLS